MNDESSTLRRHWVLSTRTVHRVRELRVFRELCWGIVRRGGVRQRLRHCLRALRRGRVLGDVHGGVWPAIDLL